MTGRRRRWWLGVIFVLAVLAAGGVWWGVHPRAPKVTVATVVRKTMQDEVYTSGVVRPVQTQTIYASNLPAPVDSIPVKTGQTVHKGDVLVRLKTSDGVSLPDASTPSTVRARFDGIVLSVNVDGVDSSGNPAPLVQVVSHDLQVVTQVSQVDAVRIRPGMKALLSSDAWPNKTWTGTVSSVADYAVTTQSGGTGQVEVDIRPPSSFPVPIGYNLDVRIIRDAHQGALSVPYSALIPAGDGFAVWVVRSDQTVHEQTVTLGITTDTDVEVLRGLSAGERVVTNPPAELREGERVTVS